MTDPVICKSLRRTSLGFDDYVSYPTVRHVILDTTRTFPDPDSRPVINTSAPMKSSDHCYCQYPKNESTKKLSELDSHRNNLKLRPNGDGSDVSSSSSSESPEPVTRAADSSRVIVTTDLDCPMCLQRVTNSLNRDHQSKSGSQYDDDDNDHVQAKTKSSSLDHPPSRPDRGVHFSSDYHSKCFDSNQNENKDDQIDHKHHLKKDIDANFKPGQVFAITRPSLFGSSKKKVTFDNEFDTQNVVMTFHQRRGSAYPNAPQRRPSAIVSTFFGTSGFGRRFSEDLRLKPPGDIDGGKGETYKVLIYQVFIPFLIAGFGNVAAGVLLEVVQHWPVYKSLPELFLLVASFLGFKGNLEMALAARLATQSHLGQLDRPSAQVKILIGNVALIQAQAIVVGFLAALIAIIVNAVRNYGFNASESMLLMSTSLMTATVTGLIMTVMMVVVTILARRIGANPDNVSTLTAACLGDILAVVILSYSAKIFHGVKLTAPNAEATTIATFILIVLPISLLIARKNCYTRSILGTGWYPIIIAMCISSVGGLIFDIAVEYFDTIAIFEPIINGVGSNLVAVQASRISTYFHQRCTIGDLPDDPNTGRAHKVCQTPFRAFFGSSE